MEAEKKNAIEAWLGILALISAVVGGAFSLMQWRTDQDWKRAEKTDALIVHFESDPALRLAALAVDYTQRTVTFGKDEPPVSFTNADVLMSLRDDMNIPCGGGFSDPQVKLRDAFDAFVAFFVRLEHGLKSELIDQTAAEGYFSYYLDRFLTLSMHSDITAPQHLVASEMSSEFVSAYSDVNSIRALAGRWKLKIPERLKSAARPSLVCTDERQISANDDLLIGPTAERTNPGAASPDAAQVARDFATLLAKEVIAQAMAEGACSGSGLQPQPQQLQEEQQQQVNDRLRKPRSSSK